MNLNPTSRFALAAVAASALATTSASQAAMFVSGADPTTTFDSLLLDDVTPTGGFDSSTETTFNPARDLDIPTGMGDVDLTITGIGLNPRGGTATTEETVTVTITYFGADNALNTSDDELLGSRTATLQYAGAVDEYTAVFDTPITAQIDGAEDRFRIAIASTGNLRLKGFNAAAAPSGQNGIKISLGGTATLAVPEPASFLVLSIAGLVAPPRRRQA